MHSFLVSHPPPQFPPSPDCLHIIPETSIGISEVRQIQIFLSKKPLQSDQNTIIVHQAEKLTLPAQHALLKTLEEPPGNSQIFLVTTFPDQLLPTILSRVQIDSPDSPNLPDSSDTFNLINLLLSTKSVGERLKLFDDQSFTRETFSQFLDCFEIFLHQNILKSDYSLMPSAYSLISDSKKYLKSNVSLRLILDNLVINLNYKQKFSEAVNNS